MASFILMMMANNEGMYVCMYVRTHAFLAKDGWGGI